LVARPGPAHAKKGRLDWRRPLTGHWPLVIILTGQAALSLRLVWSNGAFTDEALYLWAGHLEWAHWLHGAPIPNFPSFFSGAPVVYPPLGALADSLGGLAAARILSLFFMLGATILLYGTANRLLGRKTAILACALFAAVGPTADLGAFATYDAMAVFLLALASWLAVRASGRLGEWWLAAAALVMVTADATKYASGLWNPVIVALAILAAPGVRRAGIARGIRLGCYAAMAAVPMLILLGGNVYVHGLLFTTVTRAGTGDSVQTVLWTAATYIGVLTLLAIAGLRLNWHAGTRMRLLSAALAVALILAPVDEAHIGTIQSLYKHVIFGAWFGAILAGYALSRATEVNRAKGWRIGAAAAVFVALLGAGQAVSMFGYWPDSAAAVAITLKDAMAAGGNVLTAEANVAQYDIIAQHLPISSGRIISYVDHGGLAHSPVALIRNRDVSIVELDLYASTPGMDGDSALLAALPASGYQLRTRLPWTDAYTHGWFEIWQRIGQ
jgi:4-amino-4-deoxy-L-arabinose transferase-like glycosyltransferase